MAESSGDREPTRAASPASQPAPNHSLRWQWVSVLFVVLGLLGFSVDLDVYRFCRAQRARPPVEASDAEVESLAKTPRYDPYPTRNVPGTIRNLLDVAETFGNGIGATILVGAVFLIDPTVLPAAPRFVASSLGSGIASNIFKLAIARTRPDDFARHHDLASASIWETFQGWWPLLMNKADTQGFPSSHTATAFGLAVVLSWRYPRGTMLFFALAILCGCQRVVVGMHYVSDVCMGAALGWTVGCLCVYGPYPARWFDAWERSDRAKRLAARLGGVTQIDSPAAIADLASPAR